MRIISKDRDYYDSVMAHGTDPSVTYLRERSRIPAESVPEAKAFFEEAPGYHGWSRVGENTLVTAGLLLFCGRAVPFLRVIETLDGETVSSRTAYSREEFESHALPNLPAHVAKQYPEPVWKKGWRRFRTLQKDNVSRFFEKDHLARKAAEEIHVRLKAPVVGFFELYGAGRKGWSPWRAETVVEANPLLSEIRFFQVVDPFSAFQEIGSFLSGVLGNPGPKMVAVSDAVRAHKHGMDKTSFRTPSPGPRKARRRGTAAATA